MPQDHKTLTGTQRGTFATPPLTLFAVADEQVAHFLENGWLKIEKAFTAEQAAEWTASLWARLGMDPDDKSTWKESTHMPWHKREPVANFAPKAWGAMCDLLGGEERIEPMFAEWADSFIVNLGSPQLSKLYEEAAKTKAVTKGGDMMNPADLDNWHVDGDFFVHFLDSPEQALLVIPIYSPIEPLSGGTYICPTAMPAIAAYLAAHPEGVVPTPIHNNPAPPHGAEDEDIAYLEVVKRPGMRFTELTGAVGDVILMHPLMLHSASRNWRRAVRVITNPPVGLKDPFCFGRLNAWEYSLVEQKTLMVLGAWADETGICGLKSWKATGERRRIVPPRLMAYGQLEAAEKARMEEWKKAPGPEAVVSSTASISTKA
ncbi:hypothetical protein AURDEDRAFT_69467 [Auricularia subglabra TFB-10046 SS5]|uniref:Clavaminate synthase-like protein n=1 Tax=Auricularia subglabra (strain TFB-10046 / SS5) TaxID=717982 RepID=J0D2B1_AURST|nr:hypothetical protein AURDEDRAFT_69467 [Auricularia subglabra TFB-10046 SS5]